MNGIVEIKLDGKLRTLRFNNYAKAELGNIYGTDPLEAAQKLAERMQDNHMRTMADLIYAGLTGACYARSKDRDFTMEDVAEWVADADEAELLKVFNTWVDATSIRQILELQATAETAAKKKEAGMMS